MWTNSLLCILATLHFALVDGTRYMSCTEISDYCSAHGTTSQNLGSETPHTNPIYRPGKQGVKGQKGDVGPTGPVSVFDYEGFERRILRKVAEMFANCGVFYDGKCFKLVGAAGTRYSKEDLQQKCTDIGGKLANLYSDKHRLAVGRYIRAELGVYAQIALGMTYNVETGRFRLTSGEWVDIVFKWHPGYPKSDVNKQNMFFSVLPTAGDSGQGAFNYLPSNHEHYGLCEYDMDF